MGFPNPAKAPLVKKVFKGAHSTPVQLHQLDAGGGLAG
jgi:hypothetical protein